jgi:hypothetical protein
MNKSHLVTRWAFVVDSGESHLTASGFESHQSFVYVEEFFISRFCVPRCHRLLAFSGVAVVALVVGVDSHLFAVVTVFGTD